MNQFFKVVESIKTKNDEVVCRVQLDAEHPVYLAHFPNHPITPGALFVQMVVDLYNVQTAGEHTFVEAKNIKFLKPHNPQQTPLLDVRFNVAEQPVHATIENEEGVYARMTLFMQ